MNHWEESTFLVKGYFGFHMNTSDKELLQHTLSVSNCKSFWLL